MFVHLPRILKCTKFIVTGVTRSLSSLPLRMESFPIEIASTPEEVEQPESIWNDLFNEGKKIAWRSSDTRSLFFTESPQSSMELLFSNKQEYVNSFLAGSMFIHQHPISSLARELVGDSDNQSNANGMGCLVLAKLIMLCSKLFEDSKSIQLTSTETRSVIERQQCHMSITAELLFLSQRFHGTVVDTPINYSLEEQEVIHRGNKLATLIGDLLITRIYAKLSTIQNCKVTEIFSSALAVFAENFMLNQDAMHGRKRNVNNANVGLCQLLGKSFRSSMILAGHDNNLQLVAEELGYRIGQIVQILEVEAETSASQISRQLKQETIDFISRINGNTSVTHAINTLLQTV